MPRLLYAPQYRFINISELIDAFPLSSCSALRRGESVPVFQGSFPTATAILDRLLHHCRVINIRGYTGSVNTHLQNRFSKNRR